MAERVVTADVQDLLGVGVVVLAATTRPYNPSGLPPPWRTGHYLDLLVRLPAGIPDGGVLVGDGYEYTDDVPTRLLEEGVGHRFLGIERLPTLPTEPPTDARVTTITLDLGGRANYLFTGEIDVIPLDPGQALELYVTTRGNSNATRVVDRIYDSLDEHPTGLRLALEKRGTNRRQTSADDPGDWDSRRPPQ